MMRGKLTPATVSLSSLYLDPNNPRFADTGEISRQVPEQHVHEQAVQDRAMSRIFDRFDVQQLQDSIQKIGFLPVDRLVVVELPEKDHYMVIEGNRRLAALKSIVQAEERHEIDELPADIRESVHHIPVLIIDGENKTERNRVARILQGVRHVSSVKQWGPYQQAQLIIMMLEEGREVSEVKETLGLPMRDINRLRRVYYALEQMRKDPDYTEFAKPSLFSQFDEALKQPKLREWLDWDDEQGKCLNEEHRHMFYDWCIGMEDDGQRLPPKIVDAKDVRRFPDLQADPMQFKRFSEDPRLSLQDASRGVATPSSTIDWRGLLQANLNTLNQVPAVHLIGALPGDVELLKKLRELCDKLIAISEQ